MRYTDPAPTVALSTRVPQELRQAVELRAEQEGGVSLTAVIVRALEAYLAQPITLPAAE